MLATVGVMLGLCCGCASDNVHQPQPDLTPDPSTYQGEMFSRIPVFPTFAGVTAEDYAVVTWADEAQSSATITTGAFDVQIAEMGFNIQIGEMNIPEVGCFRQGDGSIELSNLAFECQAGDYYTTGSLEGVVSGDSISIVLKYRPGSMPFEVESTFTGQLTDQ
ncbi:MAG: hypothetical protein LIP03_12540 [Bacteroidales bacterium]|nr:hypothetical protein [Bacteroidales bacterium]